MQQLGPLLRAALHGQRHPQQGAEPRVVARLGEGLLQRVQPFRRLSRQQVRDPQLGAGAGVVGCEAHGRLQLGDGLLEQSLARQVGAVRRAGEGEVGCGERGQAQRGFGRGVVQRRHAAPRGGEHEGVGRIQRQRAAEALEGFGLLAQALRGHPGPGEQERVLALLVEGGGEQVARLLPPLLLPQALRLLDGLPDRRRARLVVPVHRWFRRWCA